VSATAILAAMGTVLVVAAMSRLRLSGASELADKLESWLSEIRGNTVSWANSLLNPANWSSAEAQALEDVSRTLGGVDEQSFIEQSSGRAFTDVAVDTLDDIGGVNSPRSKEELEGWVRGVRQAMDLHRPAFRDAAGTPSRDPKKNKPPDWKPIDKWKLVLSGAGVSISTKVGNLLLRLANFTSAVNKGATVASSATYHAAKTLGQQAVDVMNKLMSALPASTQYDPYAVEQMKKLLPHVSRLISEIKLYARQDIWRRVMEIEMKGDLEEFAADLGRMLQEISRNLGELK